MPSLTHRSTSSERDPSSRSTVRRIEPGSSNSDVLQDMESMMAESRHTVEEGDSLWSIAAASYGNGTLWPQLREANPDRVFDDGDLIFVGTELVIPRFEPCRTSTAEQRDPLTGCPTPNAVTSHTENTSYGVYEVFPDGVSMDIAPANRLDSSIPIRRSDFTALESRMAKIESLAGSIRFSGSDDFEAAVLSDFGWLLSQSIGRNLIDALDSTGRSVGILETSGGNLATYRPSSDSWTNEDGTPGPGCNVIISYNPVNWNPYGGSETWMNRPPAIGLAHELVHALSGMSGTRARGADSDGVRNREQQATGLAEFSDQEFSENRFRAAFGLPTRSHY